MILYYFFSLFLSDFFLSLSLYLFILVYDSFLLIQPLSLSSLFVKIDAKPLLSHMAWVRWCVGVGRWLRQRGPDVLAAADEVEPRRACLH